MRNSSKKKHKEEEEEIEIYTVLNSKAARRPIIEISSDSESEREHDSSDSDVFSVLLNPGEAKRNRKKLRDDESDSETEVIILDADGEEQQHVQNEQFHEEDDEIDNDFIDAQLMADPVLMKAKALLEKFSKKNSKLHHQDAHSSGQNGDGVEVDSTVEVFENSKFIGTAIIVLQIRINQDKTVDFAVYLEAPFEDLYKSIGKFYGITIDGIRLVLDGMALSHFENAKEFDLENGDLIEALVDFEKNTMEERIPSPEALSPVNESHIVANSTEGRLIRLSLRLNGCRRIVFKLRERAPLKKLLEFFCKQQGIAEEEVVMKIDGEKIDFSKTVDFYDMDDDDIIDVVFQGDTAKISNQTLISVKLRLLQSITPIQISKNTSVAGLVEAYLAKTNTSSKVITLEIDGEKMNSTKLLEYYDLEGDEIIEVILPKPKEIEVLTPPVLVQEKRISKKKKISQQSAVPLRRSSRLRK